MVVEVAIWAEVVSGARVVDGESDRWPASDIGMQRIWSRFGPRLVWVWHVERYRRLGQSQRRRLQRSRRWWRGAGWWGCSLWGAEDVVAAEVGPLVWWDPLGEEVGVDGVRAQDVLAQRQRLEWLVAVTYLHGGGAFARMPHAGIVTGAADRAG